MRKLSLGQPALPSFLPSCRITARLYPGPPALLDSKALGSGGGGQASHPGAKGCSGALRDSAPLSHALPEPRHPRAQILDCNACGQPRSEGAQLGARQSGRTVTGHRTRPSSKSAAPAHLREPSLGVVLQGWAPGSFLCKVAPTPSPRVELLGEGANTRPKVLDHRRPFAQEFRIGMEKKKTVFMKSQKAVCSVTLLACSLDASPCVPAVVPYYSAFQDWN
nr:uncharacterized protein LOC110122200 [Odocoileus virginianus texanus]